MAPAPLPTALPASFVAVAKVLAIAPARTPTQVSAPIQNVGSTRNIVAITKLSSMSPNAAKEFGLVSSVSVIFTLVPYLYTCAALLLLGHGHFGKARPAYLAVTTIAFLYCIWAVVGSGAKEVMWSFVTLMVITAMYALNYNRLHKNPYPLDAPISKD